jgi:hypothetical protein
MSLKRFLFRSRWDDERARELEAYVEIETDDNLARGMPPREARLAAERKLGNRTLVREEIYQMNTISLLDSAWRDLKYGARLLRMNPGFAFVAILSLALGVGANTAIFQLLDAVRLRTNAGEGSAAAGRDSHWRHAERPHRLVHRAPPDADQPFVGKDSRSAGGVLERDGVGNAVVQPDHRRGSAICAGPLG